MKYEGYMYVIFFFSIFIIAKELDKFVAIQIFIISKAKFFLILNITKQNMVRLKKMV